jgi:acetylornithine deacetylase/succinyl-diaminopimelate desuccinylase-like protein
MRISEANIAADIEAIAAITDTPGVHARPTFSPAWAQARAYVLAEAEKIGCRTWTDAFGNVHLRPANLPDSAKVWLSGSHIDSVPTGGKFDGVTGVVVPLEILRAAHAAGQTMPLELVVFAEEEGTTFNLGMLGSRAWSGTLSADQLVTLRNKEGIDPLTAGKAFGVDAGRFAAELLRRDHYHGFIEVHVEQGPAMWERGERVAIVTAINGRKQYSVTIIGEPNHAGSTPMQYRKDALVGAAECVVALERLALAPSPGTPGEGSGEGQVSTRAIRPNGPHPYPLLAYREREPENVLTVGQITTRPNAINVIAGEVTFTIDFRSPSNTVLSRATADIETTIRAIVDRRKLNVAFHETESLPAMAMDAQVVAALRAAAARCGIANVVETSSGALHDAAILAPIMPSAMLFVASRGGISHNPAEFSRIEDIAAAARVLAAVVNEGAG